MPDTVEVLFLRGSFAVAFESVQASTEYNQSQFAPSERGSFRATTGTVGREMRSTHRPAQVFSAHTFDSFSSVRAFPGTTRSNARHRPKKHCRRTGRRTVVNRNAFLRRKVPESR